MKTLVLDGDTFERQRDGFQKRTAMLHEIRIGDAYRETVTYLSHGQVENTGYTGHIYWSSDENGFVFPARGDAAKYHVSADSLFNETTALLTGRDRGDEAVRGVACRIIRVQPPFGDAVDLYVDPQTGRYQRAVLDPGGTYETAIDILGYTDAVAGKKIISKWSYDSGSYREWTKIGVNVPVSPTQLHPPTPSATWMFTNPNPFQARLITAPNGSPRIMLDATLNGVRGRFILDTGAALIALKQDFADRAHVKPYDLVATKGIGGQVRESLARLRTLEVGGNALHNVVAEVINLGSGTLPEADGALGTDLLGGAIVTLDLDADQMTIRDPHANEVDTSRWLTANVDLSSGIPRIPMKLDGIDVVAELDTGDAAAVLYGHDLIFKYGLTTLKGAGYIAGVGGRSAVQCGQLQRISFGPIRYENPVACESPDLDGSDILVGIDFLKHFNFVFDYPQGVIVLIPRRE